MIANDSYIINSHSSIVMDKEKANIIKETKKKDSTKLAMINPMEKVDSNNETISIDGHIKMKSTNKPIIFIRSKF